MQTAEPSAPPPRAPAQPWIAAGLVGLLVLSVALRFPSLTAEPLWYDEIFSVVVAANTLPDIIALSLADQTNPPGFYLLLAAWIRLGDVGDAWLRALPALAGTLTPLALVHAARRLRLSWATALVAGGLAAVSPMLIAKSLEVRAYTMLVLLATLALAQVADLMSRADAPGTRAYVGLGTSFAAMVMLHYFGALSVAALVIGGVLLVRETARTGAIDRAAAIARGRRLVVAAVPSALLLGGWLALVARRGAASEFGATASWIEPPTVRSLNILTSEVIGGFGSPLLTWGVFAVLLAALATAATARSGRGWLVLSAATLPLVLALTAGWALDRPLWVARYLIATVPPLLLLLAMLVTRIRAPWRAGMVTLTLGWGLLAALHYLGDHRRKSDWSALLHELARGRPAVVCVNETYVSLSLEFHARRDGLPVEVRRFSACGASPAPTWAIYQPRTAGALAIIRARGATLGPRFSLQTEFPPTEARAVRWVDR